mgnify:CR=1 FL=1
MPELKSSTVALEKIKDRYQEPMTGGYRDISLILRVFGMVCELQLNLKEVVDIKGSPAGHGLYEKTRLLNDDLLYAAMHGKTDEVQRCLQEDANANVCDGRFGISALNFGAVTGDMTMVIQLLTKGADPCVVDNLGILPAHRSAQFGFEDVTGKIVEAMLKKPPAKHNCSTKAANRFSEFLGVVVDNGWRAMAKDLYDWWSTADAMKPVPVLERWLELGWKTTIQRASDVFDVGFFHKEVCPELLDLRFAGTPGAREEDEEEDAKMLQLDLSCIGIGDERVVSVAAALKQIQLFRTLQLGLDFTKFNFSFATNVALTDNAYPMQINLSGNDIGDAGAKSLAKALRIYGGIIHVDLQRNGIGDYGVQSLADVLKSNQSIVEMKLWGNPIHESGARALSNAFQANHVHAAYLREAHPDELLCAFKITATCKDVNQIGRAHV